MKVRFPFCSLSQWVESPPHTLRDIDWHERKVTLHSLNPFHILILPLKILESRNHASSNLHFCTPVPSVRKCQQKSVLLLLFWLAKEVWEGANGASWLANKGKITF